MDFSVRITLNLITIILRALLDTGGAVLDTVLRVIEEEEGVVLEIAYPASVAGGIERLDDLGRVSLGNAIPGDSDSSCEAEEEEQDAEAVGALPLPLWQVLRGLEVVWVAVWVDSVVLALVHFYFELYFRWLMSLFLARLRRFYSLL